MSILLHIIFSEFGKIVLGLALIAAGLLIVRNWRFLAETLVDVSTDWTQGYFDQWFWGTEAGGVIAAIVTVAAGVACACAGVAIMFVRYGSPT